MDQAEINMYFSSEEGYGNKKERILVSEVGSI